MTKSTASTAQSRLNRVLSTVSGRQQHPVQPQLGTLRLGSLKIPVYDTHDKDRLPRDQSTLDWSKSQEVVDDLEWMLQKYQIGQDMFLIGAPGPYARRLANTFARLLNKPIEFVALHRDVGEADLKQGREIRAGGSLEYVDSAAVRAAKAGSILVLDGIERCERGVLPTLNNLLENREINLEDGTHVVSADRYDKMAQQGEDTTNFIPAHRDFRVIAIGTPTPPYPGYPLDPPFRSRFQARYLDPLSTSKILASQVDGVQDRALEVVGKLSAAISTVQISREMKGIMASGITSSDEVPMFPQTALSKMTKFLTVFPPPADPSLVSTEQAINLLLSLHPSLAYMDRAMWRSLDAAFESAHAGDWFGEMAESDPAGVAASGEGIMGWRLDAISRASERTASLSFSRGGIERVDVEVAAGGLPFSPYPLNDVDYPGLYQTPRFDHLLTSLFQLHALGNNDIAFVPPSSSLQNSSGSTSLLIQAFASLLGYELETFHLYKELGGRELLMRRVIETDEHGVGKGVTRWEPSLLTTAATQGSLVHLESIDTLGPTANSIGRLFNDREAELWEGKRLVRAPGPDDSPSDRGILSYVHPSFKIIATPSKSQEPKMWLTEELASGFLALPSVAMPLDEEKHILLATGCAPQVVDQIETFARAYRRQNSVPGSKSRRLGTASLVRIAKRLALFPDDDLYTLLNRTVLSDFLPQTNRQELASLFKETGIAPKGVFWNPPAIVKDGHLVFPPPSAPNDDTQTVETAIPLFDMKQDSMGASHVPYMNNYLDNSQQTALLRDIAVDLEMLGEHVLLLGNQGVGKNKIIDRLMQLLNRPREFIQLHRDTTTQSLMFQTTLEGGVIHYVDSPLLRAVQLGRVLVIDEVDKAPTPVVAALASLASRGEMSLADGRKIRPKSQQNRAAQSSKPDIIVHDNFRLVLLANRPGVPFLGNPFLRVLGDNFAPYAVGNPDVSSEQRVLSQLAPDLDENLLRSLVGAFAELRAAFETGSLSYPFSLRELLALVRHMKSFPDDPLESTLRNVFDFDALKPEVNEMLYNVLRKHKLNVQRVGLEAVRAKANDRQNGEAKPKVIDFTPKDQSELDPDKDQPKFGKTDDKQHTGGNTWAGGTGGKSTAGLGGRGGYMRLYKPGTDINQIPDALKANVPEEIKAQAREMARKELAKKLAELDMTTAQSGIYSSYYDSVSAHIQQLVTFLDNLEANEEERVWLKRQGDGDLDESRLAEGLTGEATIYKRRGLEKPELGRPQMKPKRIRFVLDLSASMYRNQYDGRLARSLESAVLILEAFGSRISRKDKYRLDLVGHSGEEVVIPLVPVDTHTKMHEGDRFKVVQKMALVSQYCWAGDHTLEAIEKAVETVAQDDADDWFVIAITDANFSRYGITAADLKRVMNANAKVKTALVAIGEGAEVTWLPKVLPGQAHRVANTGDIATTLRTILSSMLGGEL
ncbi:hypothetical protein ACM66B_004269 [Microbotryomycetes sp. NB124-2]